MEESKLFCPEMFGQRLADFRQVYDLRGISVCHDTSKRGPYKRDRICRFCGKQMPETTFEHDAHIFPEYAGNKNFLSYEECDKCNTLFGEYERHLANFMGMTRSIHGIAEKTRIPGFVALDKSIEASAKPFFGTNAVKIERKHMEGQHIDVDWEKGITQFTYDKLPYRPQYVMKALIKMVLSVLPHEDLLHYTKALQYISGRTISASNLAKVVLYTLPVENHVTPPYLILFRRKGNDPSIPADLCMIRLEHFIFHFLIPAHDEWAPGESDPMPTIPVCPPLAFHENFQKAMVQAQTIDLSSMEEMIESASFSFEMTGSQMKDLKGWDPVTQQEVETSVQPGDIKGIYLVHDKNFSLPFTKKK